MIAEKRKARKRWQQTRFPIDKLRFNLITTKLKQLLRNYKNLGIQSYLGSLNATAYSLWKVTKKLKRPILTQPPIRKKMAHERKATVKKPPHLQHIYKKSLLPIPLKVTLTK